MNMEHRHSIEVRHLGIDAGTCRLGDQHRGCCPNTPDCGMPGETRPLVIVGIYGGLAQWEIVKPGTGLPRLHILDFDRDGATVDELDGLVADIKQARDELAEYGNAQDTANIGQMTETAEEYRAKVREVQR